jgi:hypothetical protein
MENGRKDELYEEIERRALFELADDDDEEQVDLVAELRPQEEPTADVVAATADLTLAGYIAKHDRVPAFEGSDGQPYTVDVDVEEDEHGRFVAFYVFVRWAATGAGIMDHRESGDIAHAGSEEDARAAALDRTLSEVKAELDAAIARRQATEQ